MGKKLKKIIGESYGFYQKKILNRNQSWIFLLGHMRSGSSLLMHLLMNHPEILGLGERNLPYDKETDLWKLALKSRIVHKSYIQSYRFFVDQINHNKLTLDTTWWERVDLYPIFLIREPAASIASLLKLSEKYYQNKWTLQMAINYYIERLDGMETIFQSLPTEKKPILIQYETLIADTAATLYKIQTYLNLEKPFSTTYKVFDFTGKSGDPSKQIKAGKILERKEKTMIDLSPEDLTFANHAYQKFKHLL